MMRLFCYELHTAHGRVQVLSRSQILKHFEPWRLLYVVTVRPRVPVRYLAR